MISSRRGIIRRDGGKYDATTGAVIDASFITGLSNPSGLATAAPEPGSAVLLLGGALVVLGRRSVRQRI